MIDTHAHLSSRFEQEVDLRKLDWIILSASSLADSKDNLEIAKTNLKLKPAVGIHPQEINDSAKKLEELITKEVVAIGECGLEFTPGVDKIAQEKLFRDQIELAIKYQKPLIVHSREASDETIKILNEYQNLRGVIHCYTGGKKRINKIPEQFYFGIDGNITYEVGLEEVIRNIPRNRLVLETDTPFLTPIPHRGEKNKPEYIEYVYQKVAEIWELSFKETEEIIDTNASNLFLKIVN